MMSGRASKALCLSQNLRFIKKKIQSPKNLNILLYKKSKEFYE
jgi:hypothetical protein